MNELVFIPGLNCTQALYAHQVQAFAGKARCQIGDHGGHDTLPDIAAAILARAPERFGLIGLSMGGYVAFEMLRQQPDRITKLALLDTRATMDSVESRDMRIRTIEMAKRGQFEALHGMLWQKLVHPERLSDQPLQDTVVQMMRETGAERFIRQQTAILNRIDYAALLGDISLPTLVAVGAEDAITPPVMGRELAKGIRNSQYVEIPECGHLSTLERPEILSKLLLEWFLY